MNSFLGCLPALLNYFYVHLNGIIMSKKLQTLLFVLFILLFVNVKSQSWIKQGAKWNYDSWSTLGSNINILKYTKDTTMYGQNCQQIVEIEFPLFYYSPNNFTVGNPYPPRNWFTYNTGDTVYYLQDSTFFILYNFSANIGDSWMISDDTIGGCNLSIVTVVDTGSVIINNQKKKFLDIETNVGSKQYFKGKIVEGIGMVERGSGINSTIFPREIACDTNAVVDYYFYTFHCFDDSVLGEYNPTTVDCDHWFVNSSIEDGNKSDISVALFPNPAENIINFEVRGLSKTNVILEIFNIVGIQMKSIIFVENTLLDISELSSGVYFFHLKDENNSLINTGKFIKI